MNLFEEIEQKCGPSRKPDSALSKLGHPGVFDHVASLLTIGILARISRFSIVALCRLAFDCVGVGWGTAWGQKRSSMARAASSHVSQDMRLPPHVLWRGRKFVGLPYSSFREIAPSLPRRPSSLRVPAARASWLGVGTGEPLRTHTLVLRSANVPSLGKKSR